MALELLPQLSLRRPPNAISLPPLVDEQIRLTLSSEEQTFYTALHNTAVHMIDMRRSRIPMFHMFMRLRQAALHPALVVDALKGKKGERERFLSEAARSAAKPEDGADKMLKVFIDRLQKNKNQFAQQTVAALQSGTQEETECGICFEEYSAGGDGTLGRMLSCGHRLCHNCCNTIIKKPQGGLCPFCKQHIRCADVVEIPASIGAPPPPPPGPTALDLDLNRVWTTSTKIIKAVALVSEILTATPNARIVIFSLFAKFLKSLEAQLQSIGTPCVLLDSVMTRRVQSRVIVSLSR